MILIADSGSTKTDWLAIQTNTKESFPFETIGFNPMIQKTEFIKEQIGINTGLVQLANLVQKIFFFGAGCSSIGNNNKVLEALKFHFPKATIQVDHDMNGAVIALCQGKPGIACILGTGSNSVLFDGENQIKEVPSLGYVLGDEASGAYFGKKLVSDFLYKKLPAEIHQYFAIELGLNADILLPKIYGEPNPNRYLASFATVLSKFRETDYVQQLLETGFNEFFNIHVLCFKNYKQFPIHFVGTLALNFKEEIERVAKKHDAQIGVFVQKPIQALANYFIQQEKYYAQH